MTEESAERGEAGVASAMLPAHLAGIAYVINQKSNGKFTLKTWQEESGQWLEEEHDDFAMAMAQVDQQG